jgi:hypothetical protein
MNGKGLKRCLYWKMATSCLHASPPPLFILFYFGMRVPNLIIPSFDAEGIIHFGEINVI